MRRAAGRHCLFFLSLLLFTYIFEQNCAQSPPLENYELLAAEHPARRRSLAATTYYVQVQSPQYITTVKVQQIPLCQQQPKQVVLHPPTQNYELLALCGRLCSTVPAIRERSSDRVRVSDSGTQSTPLRLRQQQQQYVCIPTADTYKSDRQTSNRRCVYIEYL